MSRATITTARSSLRGPIRLPGDKSISHRRALLSLYVGEDVELANYGTGDDCLTTLNCLERLGKSVHRGGSRVTIKGPADCHSAELDCGNSGTTTRLLMGMLAGCDGEWTLVGDASLSRRPMERVAAPLRMMGAQIELTDGHLPARIVGRKLTGVDYESPVASAQVKSAVLLAGLKASGVTRYREPVMTRDHTERLLGIGVDYVEWITVNPGHIQLTGKRLSGDIPGDPSTAAFWIVAALMVSDSNLELLNVLSNPLRIALIKLLREHGAEIQLSDVHEANCEGVATARVYNSEVTAFSVRSPETASLIDEIPALAVLASRLSGRSEFFDVRELRVKESDRLKLITENLRRMGAQVEVWEDGFAVTGPSDLSGAEIETGGDHRIAMAFAIAGLVAQGDTLIDNSECVAVSYPDFWHVLARLT